MEIYSTFAKVYDTFMQNVPYNEWCDYILKIWHKFELKPNLAVDLACGTGNMTLRLSKLGFDMIGIDLSEDMLTVAKSKSPEILYLCQDMREFELYGTVDAIICICDSINYLLDYTELIDVFKLVKNYLNPNGIFIFDVNTEYKLSDVLADSTYSEIFDDAAYILENYYDDSERINQYQMTFFVNIGSTGLYERFYEEHYEKSYSITEISDALSHAGLDILDIYDELTFDAPKPNSERIFFVVRKGYD